MSPARSESAAWRAVWTFGDQALSSLTNVALTIVVARAVSAGDFGAFALALMTFSFVIGLGRSMIADPYVIRFSATEGAERHRAVRQATGGAVVFGALAGVICAVAALLVPDEQSRPGLLALAVCLPGLVLQDTWRYTFFAAGRPAAAFVSDLIWTVLQFGALGLLLAADDDSVFRLTLAWGLAATVAGLAGIWQARAVPSPAAAGTWFRRTKDLNVRMGIDYGLNMGLVNVAFYAVTGIVGLIAASALRAAQTLLGPLNLFRSGLDSFVLPMMARRASAGRSVLGLGVLTSAPATAVTVVWAGILLLLPASIGTQLLGDSWDGARAVLLGVALVSLAQALAIGASLGLKALRRADLALRLTLIQSPVILVSAVIGAGIGGAVGAAWGLGIAQSAGTALCWVFFLRTDGAERPWVESAAPQTVPVQLP